MTDSHTVTIRRSRSGLLWEARVGKRIISSFADAGEGRINADVVLEAQKCTVAQAGDWHRLIEANQHCIPDAPYPLSTLYNGRFSITLRSDEPEDPDKITDSRIFTRFLAAMRLMMYFIPYVRFWGAVNTPRLAIISDFYGEECLVTSLGEMRQRMFECPGMGNSTNYEWLIGRGVGLQLPSIAPSPFLPPATFEVASFWDLYIGLMTDVQGNITWSYTQAQALFKLSAAVHGGTISPEAQPAIEEKIKVSHLPKFIPIVPRVVGIGLGYNALVYKQWRPELELDQIRGVRIIPDETWVRPEDPDELQAQEDDVFAGLAPEPPVLRPPGYSGLD